MADVHVPRSLLPPSASPRLKLTIPQNVPEEQDSDGSERIPFTESTNLKQLTDLDRHKILRNRSKENSPKRVASPKSRIRPMHNDAREQSSEIPNQRPVTPTPDEEEQQAPLTPTANLKMLFSAMSPELRDREKKKELFTDANTTSPQQPHNSDATQLEVDPPQVEELDIASSQDEWKPGSRKEKSLGLLCQKFLQKYPEHPSPSQSHEISLDEVAKELSVERRRIYDIVNVLESVEIVSRIAKNKYAWHGKTNLVNTLGKLKALGEAEGFAEQLKKVKDFELNRELEEQNSCSSTSTKSDSSTNTEDGLSGAALLRKDKSLGIMSQKFLMLFLVSEPKTVNLDLAAKILIGDPNIDRTENAKFKTKIRRLYDIANILTSLDLIRKVHVTEIRGRKPAFKYIGPNVDNMDEISVCYNDGYHRPSSRHSLLDCVKNHQVADMMCPYKPIKPNLNGKAQEGEEGESSLGSQTTTSGTKSSFRRTSSFDQICEIAEKEMTRLYGGSLSQPSSPTAETVSVGFPKSLSQEEISRSKKPIKGKAIILQQKGGQFHIVDADETVKGTHTLPVKRLVTKIETTAVPKEGTSQESSMKKEKPETIVVKTAQINRKQATMIPLTKDQIDAVLKSLKVPVPVTKNFKPAGEFKEIVHIPESQKPKGQIVETKTVMCSLDNIVDNGLKRTLPPSEESVAKKFKVDFPSPPSEDDQPVLTQSAKEHRPKLSPQKALHLTPEFNSDLSLLSEAAQQSHSYTRIDNDSDLAVPLPHSEDSQDSTSHFENKSAQNVQKITVQLPNKSPTIVQFPMVGIAQNNVTEGCAVPAPSSNVMTSLNHQMQIIQGVPLTATGIQGQPINFMVPVTFSPPLTPHNEQSSPNIFSYPSPQCNFSLPSTTIAKYPPTSEISLSSMNGKACTSSQFLTPTERPVAPPTKFFGHTPGGLVSPSTSLLTSTKEMYSTARKLDLKLDADISV